MKGVWKNSRVTGFGPDLDSNLKTEPYEGHDSNGAARQTVTVNGLVSAALQENAKTVRVNPSRELFGRVEMTQEHRVYRGRDRT